MNINLEQLIDFEIKNIARDIARGEIQQGYLWHCKPEDFEMTEFDIEYAIEEGADRNDIFEIQKLVRQELAEEQNRIECMEISR